MIFYVNRNEDVEDMLHQLNFNIKNIEKELFNARIKHETMVSPMQEYIELLLKNALIKIIDPDQQNLDTIAMKPPAKNSTRSTSTSK